MTKQAAAGADTGAPTRGARPVVLGVVGRPGSGKTALIERLIPELVARGLRVATVKRTAGFDIDMPGKDSWRHSAAGAAAYAVASPSRLAFVEVAGTEAPGGGDDAGEPALDAIVARFLGDADVVLCEGYLREAALTVEVFRRAAGYDVPVCEPGEALALVTDAPVDHEHRFALDDVGGLARFLVERLGLARQAG